jgi:hypothetical protein
MSLDQQDVDPFIGLSIVRPLYVTGPVNDNDVEIIFATQPSHRKLKKVLA